MEIISKPYLLLYMKTQKPTKTRSAAVRVSHAISLEPFNLDSNFLTNKGLLDRYNSNGEIAKGGGNIAQAEIHKSYYEYTINIDLDKIGRDENEKDESGKILELDNDEKRDRVISFIKVLKLLYRDIRGRRENLSPIFAIGGVYDRKNPFFKNRVKVKKNNLNVEILKSVLELDDEIQNNTYIGLISGIFDNNDEVVENLKVGSMKSFFSHLIEDVEKYYTQQ